jgi:hypothetical protein
MLNRRDMRWRTSVISPDMHVYPCMF